MIFSQTNDYVFYVTDIWVLVKSLHRLLFILPEGRDHSWWNCNGDSKTDLAIVEGDIHAGTK